MKKYLVIFALLCGAAASLEAQSIPVPADGSYLGAVLQKSNPTTCAPSVLTYNYVLGTLWGCSGAPGSMTLSQISGNGGSSLPTPPVSPSNQLYTAVNQVTGGVAGGWTYSAVQAVPVVTPEASGAVGNAGTWFDGVLAAGSDLSTTSSGTSTTPSAPTITTTKTNERVLNVWLRNQIDWSAAPAAGTQRLNQAFTAGQYSLTLNDQLAASAGVVAASTGTLTSSARWIGGTIPLTTSSTISFVGSNDVHQGTGATISITAPAGLQTGDWLVGCVSFFNSSTIVTYPNAFPFNNIFFRFNDASLDYLVCSYHVVANAAAEPASYVWTQSAVSNGMAAFVAAYRGVTGIDGTANVLTSATGGFTSAAVGYPVCVAVVPQICGTITGFNSATNVTLSTYLPANGSGLEFRYGQDDTTAFQTALTTAPCSTVGCTLQLSAKRYALTGGLSLPVNIPVNIVGVGAGLSNDANAFINSNTHPNKNNGSMLAFLTNSLGKPAISMAGTSHVTSFTALDTLQNFALVGGAGYNFDGGGNDGIDIVNWQGAYINGVYEANFSGRGLYIDSLSGNGYDYVEAINVANSYFTYNGGAGILIGTVGLWLETIKLDSNILETNGGPGITIAGGLGVTLTNNVLQWDNVKAAGAELSVTGGTGSSYFISGNYFETDGANSSQSTVPYTLNTTALLGCNLLNNYFFGTMPTPQTYSVAGTPLPTCVNNSSAVFHQNANVSDATVCTNGTTYAGSSTTHCVVTCNGTAWIETGAGWQ